MADPKSFFLGADVHQYLVAHSEPLIDAQRALIAETAELGGISMMQISPEQGAFITLLTAALGATRAIEVGTFTGYSAMCIARGLPADGTVICCDISEEWTSIGQPHWKAAGVDQKIDLRIAPAIETLRALPGDPVFDLAFIDADKPNYAAYYEEILQRLRPNGVILVDNVLWSGAVVNAEVQDENTVAIRAFNDMVAADTRVEASMVAIGDGLTLLRKR